MGFRYPLPGQKAPTDERGGFRYKVVGRQRRPNVQADQPVQLVKGEQTRFTGEVITYQTLLEIGWLPEDIEYQKAFAGGRNFVGGIVADFYVHSWPLPTIIFFDGNYWHEGERTWVDLENDERLRRMFNGSVNILHIFQSDSASLEVLRNKLLREIGPGLGGGGHTEAIS